MYDKHALNIAIGERIKHARTAAGYTQQQLAELIDMSPPNLSAVERGAVGISHSALLRICEALCVTTDTILRGTNEISDISHVVMRLGNISSENRRIIEEIINSSLKLIAVNNTSRN